MDKARNDIEGLPVQDSLGRKPTNTEGLKLASIQLDETSSTKKDYENESPTDYQGNPFEEPIIPPKHDERTLILCFDGTGDQFDTDVSFPGRS